MWLTAIAGAASLASSIFGGAKASQANKQASEMLAQQKRENDAWYNRRYNEDYTQTAEGRSLMNYAKQQAEELWRRADGAAAVGGGTDEAVAQAKAAGNKMISETAANVAALGTARKDTIESHYMQTNNALTQQQMQNLHNQAQNISQAAGGAASAFDKLGSSLLNNKFGGGN